MVKYPVGFCHAGFMPLWMHSFAFPAAMLGYAFDNKGKFWLIDRVTAIEPRQSATESMR
jgi:hypothetical protein